MKIVEFVVGLVLEWTTWEEKTRRRRGDDPVEADLKFLNRLLVYGFLAALVASVAWGILRASAPEITVGPFAAVTLAFADWGSWFMGWLAVGLWGLTAFCGVRLATYRPDHHDR